MKRTVLAFVMTALLTSLCAVPARSQLRTEAISQQRLPPMPEVGPLTKELDEIEKSREVFENAVYAGDLDTVKALADKYPFLLGIKMNEYKNYDSLPKFLPICIALREKHEAVSRYLLDKDPSLLNVSCYKDVYYEEYAKDTALDVVIRNGYFDVLLQFLSQGGKVQKQALAYAAYSEADIKTWKKVIPALLDAGAIADTQFEFNRGLQEGDAFFIAARRESNNFVVALRDELKKRDIPIVAHYRSIQCPGPNNSVAQEVKVKKEMQNSKEMKYLKERGIPLDVRVREVGWGCD